MSLKGDSWSLGHSLKSRKEPVSYSQGHLCESIGWIEKTQVDEPTIGSTGQGWQAPDEGAQILSLRFFLDCVAVAVMSRSEAARRLQWTTWNCNILWLLFSKENVLSHCFPMFLFRFHWKNQLIQKQNVTHSFITFNSNFIDSSLSIVKQLYY